MTCSDMNDPKLYEIREHILQQKIDLRNNTFSITTLTNQTIFLKKIIELTQIIGGRGGSPIFGANF